jgi:hypothetical protein
VTIKLGFKSATAISRQTGGHSVVQSRQKVKSQCQISKMGSADPQNPQKTGFCPIMLTKHEKWSIFLWSHPAAAKRVLKVKGAKSFLDIYFCPKKSGSKMRAYIAVACFGVLLTMLTMLPKNKKEQNVSVTGVFLGDFGVFLGGFVTIKQVF